MDIEATVREGHRKSEYGTYCQRCGRNPANPWPCDVIRLADALARERTAREQAERERDAWRSQAIMYMSSTPATPGTPANPPVQYGHRCVACGQEHLHCCGQCVHWVPLTPGGVEEEQ